MENSVVTKDSEETYLSRLGPTQYTRIYIQLGTKTAFMERVLTFGKAMQIIFTIVIIVFLSSIYLYITPPAINYIFLHIWSYHSSLGANDSS